MHSGNNDQNNQPDPEDWAMRAIRAQRLAQSNQTIWSELSRFITENQLSVHLVVLFITFVLIQSAHYRNSNRMKNEIITFLVENEVLVRGVDDYKVDHFMDHYDCYSLVSCVDRLVRVGAPSRGHHPEHAPAAAAVILTTTDEDDQRFEHVSGEPSSSWWNGFEQDDQYEEDASEKHKKIDLTSLVDAAVRRKELFILDKWLHSRSIPVSFRTRLRQHFAINSLSGLIGLLASTTAHQPNSFKANFLDSLDPLEVELFHNLRTHLFIPDTSNHHQLDQFVRRLRVDQWTACLEEDRAHFWILGTFLLSTLVPVCIIEAIRMISNFSFAYKEGKCGFLTFITGSYLAPQNCKVIFDWKGPTTVSNMITFTIKFYQRNYKPYPITPEDQLSVHITNGSQVVPCSVEFGDLNPNLANVARVSFSGKAAGHYTINIFIGNSFTHIRGSPFKDIYFRPLSPSPFETAFVNHCSTVVCTVQSFHALIVEMRDRFGNLCLLDEDVEEVLGPSENFEVTITEIVSDKKIDVCYYWQKQPGDNSRIALLLLFQSSGIYHVLVSYKGSLLKNGDFNIVCLSLSESETVKKSTTSSNKSCYFSAKLLPSTSHPFGSSSITKPKSVLCYISPKQLTIKEYILKIIPKRITTFRLSPSTKFYFVRNYNSFTKGSTSDIFGSVSSSLDNDISKSSSNSSGSFERSPNDDQFIIIDDGSQCPIELLTPERNIIVAVFTHFLLNKIGGSETFHDKQDFFNSEVRRFHQKTNHVNSGRVHLKIDRENLLESSIKATRSFSISDWCKRFEIEFVGENGIDWGGVRREWYELLCKSLFEPQYGDDIDSALYMRFKNDKQGLIHPNTNSNARLFYYEFAGRVVGKSMLDTSMGSSCKCLVNARFSRSFLAQLIGLRVNYRYFEKDDPDLYVSKIKFILENDVSALDLFFTEEEYDRKTGKLIRTFDLIPNGSHIRVTEDNKARYLDSLAQYRLSTCVKDQVEAFLKGLNDLIPDNLLSIFDENELELLLCGAATYSVSDLKLNHIVTGPTYDFQKVVDWFWRSVNNFSDEEFARLLQFTTGCSHLPPGGFADLNPRFQISSALTYGTLPTAHTCFNQICLPDYDTFDDFDRSIRIAITEGSEGFGLV